MSLSLILVVLALIVAILSAVRGHAHLWVAVVLLALAMLLPSLHLNSIPVR